MVALDRFVNSLVTLVLITRLVRLETFLNDSF